MTTSLTSLYAVVTLLAISYLSCFLRFGLTVKTFAIMAFLTVLLWIAQSDLKSRTIPDHLLLTGAGVFALYALISGLLSHSFRTSIHILLTGLSGALVISVPLLILVLIADQLWKRNTMGGGDLKLLALCGLYLGPQSVIYHLLLSCLLFIATYVLKAILSSNKHFNKNASRSFSQPFGPSIALAAWITVLFL